MRATQFAYSSIGSLLALSSHKKEVFAIHSILKQNWLLTDIVKLFCSSPMMMSLIDLVLIALTEFSFYEKLYSELNDSHSNLF